MKRIARWTRRVAVGLPAGVLGFGIAALALSASAAAQPRPRVTVCHVPPGNPSAAVTLVINASALDTHLRHGDTAGPCPAPCVIDADCDDGDPCTEDFCEDATQVCRNSAKRCEDGDACTVDSCNPTSGACVAAPVVCAPGLACSEGTCVAPLLADGELCEEASECGSGNCVDDFCCGSGCAGVCQACDLSGSEGACAPIPDGSDPGSECGAVSCTGYFYGWVADTCYRKADVGAGQASCGGDSACRSQAEECAAQTTQGQATLSCSAGQQPNLSTCSGTTPGQCIAGGG